MTQKTDGRAVVANMTYDNAGRMLTRTFPAATAENVTYAYDSITGGNKGIGRLTGLTDQSGSTAIVYDARGNVTQETRAVATKTYIVAYLYDLADRVTQITYPSGRIVTYVRDAQGRITSVTTKQTSTAATATVASGIGYAPLSRLISALTYGNTLTETDTWSLDYELSRCVVADGATLHVDRTVARADNLNVTAIIDAVTPANNQAFGYSAANRLGSAVGPYGTLGWTFDGVGNRTSEVSTPPGGATTTDIYAYPATSNRLMTVTRGASTVRQITYDGAGNILTDNRSGTTTTYTYNKRNRLMTATSGALVWGYAYNAREQLVSRNLNTGGTDLTHFVHDSFGNVIAEADGTRKGSTTREYIWLPETEIAPTVASRTQVDRPLGVVDGVGTSGVAVWMVHVDHLNRPVRMTNAAKAVVWNATWLPWGGVHAITGTGTLNARFPGQWYQLEAGLHYNWHRSYDPTLGRYTQPDPLGFVDGPGVYGYAKGSPYQGVDPDGRNSTTWGGAIGGAVGGIPGRIIGACIGTAIGVVLEYTRPKRKHPKYDKCIAAANGSNDEWEQFCDTIPPVVRGNVAGNDGAWRQCHEKTRRSRQEKINWCENQFGKDN